jgi:hypothetical protein
LVLSQQKIASDTSQHQNMSFMTWTFTPNVLIKTCSHMSLVIYFYSNLWLHCNCIMTTWLD